MNRRNFIKRGALVVPMIFIPRLIRAQSALQNGKLQGAIIGQVQPQGAGTSTAFITSLTGSTAAGFNGKVGHRFQPASAISVVSLGRYVISGNSATHVVRLWDAGTTGTQCTIELANVTVNTSGQTAGTFIYGSITPVVLDTSHFYSVYSDESSGGDQYLSSNGSCSTTAAGTINASTYYDTSCHVDLNGVHSYGVNWKYQ